MKNKRHRKVAFEVLNPKVTAAIVYTKSLPTDVKLGKVSLIRGVEFTR